MSNLIQFQLEFNQPKQQDKKTIIAEFQSAIKKWQKANNETERQPAAQLLEKSRTILILDFNYDLPAICNLVDSTEGDAA